MKTRIAALVLAVVMMLSLAVSASAEVKTSYTAYDVNFVEEVGWNFNYDVTLFITGDNTYSLMVKVDATGTTDPGNKAEKTIIYSGAFTSAPAADGEAAHLDITLDTCDAIYLEQHDKGWGRDALAYAMMLNTAAWTEDMDEMAMMSRDEFLANHSVAGLVITVEDLYLDLDDVTLANKIVAIDGDTPNYDTLVEFVITE